MLVNDVLHFSSWRRQKGFTLVELLVVIAIIGVLATLVLLQLGTARAKSRDTQRITAVSQARSAIELYMDDNNTPPVAATYDALCTLLKTGSYLSACPTLTGMSYGYTAASKKFQVAAALETRAAALDADSDINAAAYTVPGVNGTTDVAAGVACAATTCYYDLGN